MADATCSRPSATGGARKTGPTAHEKQAQTEQMTQAVTQADLPHPGNRYEASAACHHPPRLRAGDTRAPEVGVRLMRYWLAETSCAYRYADCTFRACATR